MQRKIKEDQKETTIIGIVREISGNPKSVRVGIAVGNEIYTVKPNEEGVNLLYEVGNKVEATGVISITKEFRRRIEVSGYEVYERAEDDPDEFEYDLEIRPNSDP